MINDSDGRRPVLQLRFAAAVALAGVFLWVGAGAAAAQKKQTTYPAEVEAQCTDDYFRHCSPYALGSTELRRCMESKGRNLSPNCRQALKDAGYVKGSKRGRKG